MVRNAPNAEESKYMIDPECIKVITHLFEALLPPGIMIFTHPGPVISREAPILTSHRKIIRRCTCLHAHMIQFRMLPCIGAITINAYRDVSFYNHTVLVR